MNSHIIPVTAFDGFSFELSVDVDGDAYHKAVALGGTLNWTWEFTIRYLRPDDVFLDAGANIGTFAIPASLRCRKVYAVELLEENIRHLHAAAQANNLTNIDVIHAAVWDSAGMVASGGKSAWGVVNRSAPPAISAVQLDSFLEGVGPNFIKIDVEGSELRALQGAERILAAGTADFVIEGNTVTCGNNGYSYRDLLRIFETAGYSVYRLMGRRLVPWRSDTHVQEVVIADYFATKRALDDPRMLGVTISDLTDAEIVDSIAEQALHAPNHRVHVVAVWDRLPDHIRRNERLAPLLAEWCEGPDPKALETLKVGSA